MKRKCTFLLSAFCLLAMIAPSWGQTRDDVTDVLTRELTGVSGTNYSSWSGKTSNSDAVYAGQSAGGNNSIQLRSNNNNSGIITTSSGGIVTMISVVWNSNTQNGRTLNVYGNSSPYTSPTELYSSNTQGTLIGTIVCGTSTQLIVNDYYEYIGLRSASAAMYLDTINISWTTTGTVPKVATPTFSPTGGVFGEPQTVTITCATEGATIYYTTDGSTPTTSSSVYTEPITISETTTLQAMAVADGLMDSNVASATYTIQQMTSITTIAGIWELAGTVGTTTTPASITFNDWYVTGTKGGQACVTDGQYGFVIYQSGHGFQVGDKLNGTVNCNVLMFQNHYAEVTGVVATDLTVTANQEIPVLTTTIDNLVLQNYGTVVNLGTLTYNGTTFEDAQNHTITPYNNFNLSPNPVTSLVSGGQYNVKGVSIIYWTSNNATQQIAPRSTDDFEPVSTPQPVVATPVISPESGQYANYVEVSITCATDGATIYYTLDGSDPVVAGFVYSEPFRVVTDCTVKAMAVKADCQDSEIATATYTIFTPTVVTFSKVVNAVDIDTMSNYLLVCESAGTAATGTIDKGALQAVAVGIDSVNNTILTVTDIDDYPYAVRLEAAEGGYHIVINNGYLNNGNSTSLSFGATANSVWAVNPYGDGFVLQNTSSSDRFIGGTDSNGTSYKAYAASHLGGSQYPVVVLYKEGEVTPPMPQVEAPVLLPEEGTYTGSVTVTASCITEGAVIRYTVDGENPTAVSPELPAAGIVITETTTVKVRAFKEGMIESDVVSATYSFMDTYPTIAAWKEAHTATSSAVSGISGNVTVVYQNASYLYVQDATGGLLVYGPIETTYNNGDVIIGGIFGTSTLYHGLIEFVPTGTFPEGVAGEAVQPAEVTVAEIGSDFDTYSSRLVKIVDVTFDADFTFTTSNRSTTFTQSDNTMTCFDNFRSLTDYSVTEGEVADVIGLVGCRDAVFQVYPRTTEDIVIKSTPQPVVATPVISPESGQYANYVEVSITCATDGATIYYTSDGSDPVVAGFVYSEPFRVVADCMVKAMAVKADCQDSEIATATYTIFTPTVVTFSKVVNAVDIDTTSNYLLVCESAGTAATGTIISNALQTDSVMVNFANYTVSTAVNIATYPYSIHLVAAEGGYHIAINNGYLNNPSSTSLAIGSTANSVWVINPYDGGFILQNRSNKYRFIGGTNYNGTAYKAYDTTNLGKTMYPVVYLYKEGEVAPLPTNTQVADLSTGWSWFSSYITYDDNTLSDIQNQIDNMNVTGLIKSQNAFVSNQGGFWAGSLNELDNSQMYMINLDQPISLTLSGLSVNPQEHPITLNPGWNWISFLASQEMSLDDVVGQLTPADGDVFKGQNAFASYSATMNSWVGSLTTLVPGQGYMFLNYGAQMTMTYPVAGKSMVTLGEENRFWSNDSHRYADNLTMMVTLDPSVMTLSEGSHEIAAFVGGECRGSARIQYLEGLDTYVAFLTVSGQEGEEIHFSVYDVVNDEVIENQAIERLSFVSNGVYGSLKQPFMLHFALNCLGEHESTVSVFPNPAKDKFYVQGEDLRSVTVYNTLGQVVLPTEYGLTKQVELSLGHLGVGVYTLIVNTAYGTHTTKLVVTE